MQPDCKHQMQGSAGPAGLCRGVSTPGHQGCCAMWALPGVKSACSRCTTAKPWCMQRPTAHISSVSLKHPQPVRYTLTMHRPPAHQHTLPKQWLRKLKITRLDAPCLPHSTSPKQYTPQHMLMKYPGQYNDADLLPTFR